MGLIDRLRRSDHGDDGRWLVFGLGNPEHEYGGTRHNVGADAVRRLAGELGASFKAHKSGAEVADTWTGPGGVPLTLAIPFGYMNVCGGPVQRAMRFYSVDAGRLVVAHDDLDLEVARLRLKRGGGTGGHNGLKDIQRNVGTPDFHRVRIGIGRPPGRQDPASYVLKKFSSKERDLVDVTIAHAADAVLALVTDGLDAAQNRFHPLT